MDEGLKAALIKSPSPPQCPGTHLSSTSGGLSRILTISGICPPRSSPLVLGRRFAGRPPCLYALQVESTHFSSILEL